MNTRELVTNVLFAWGLPQLHALTTVLDTTLTACPAGTGTPQLSLAFPVALVRRTDMPLMPLGVALQTLAIDIREAMARGTALPPTERDDLLTLARAWFLIAFILDYRVRRLVCADGISTHGVFGTCPPQRTTLRRFFAAARPEGCAEQYLEDMAGCSPHNDMPYARQQTFHFVAFVSSWWVCGAPVAPLDWGRTLGGVRPTVLHARKRKRFDKEIDDNNDNDNNDQ